MIVKLDSPGNYPHNGLSGFAFDGVGDLYFSLGENLGATYKLIGSDGTTLQRRRRGREHLPLPARRQPAGAIRDRLLEHLPPDVRRLRPAVRRGQRSRLARAVPAAAHRAGRRLRLPLPQRPQGAAPLHRLERRIARDAAHGRRDRRGARAASSPTNRPACRRSIAAGCWSRPGAITSSSSFRRRPAAPRSRPRPRFWCAAATTSGRSGLVTGPDGALYLSDWVDKSYPVHGKGRIWRIRAKKPPADDGLRPSAVARLAAEKLWPLLGHARREIRDAAGEALARRVPGGEGALAALLKVEDRRPGANARPLGRRPIGTGVGPISDRVRPCRCRPGSAR